MVSKDDGVAAGGGQPRTTGKDGSNGFVALASPAQDRMLNLAPSRSSAVPAAKRLTLGRIVETNGGSSLEEVSGFDSFRARNRGLFPITAPDDYDPRPGSDGFIAENVIGRDDRVPVGDTTGLPWRCIALLTITYENGARGIGTAWFLSPRSLGTAGHNIVHPDHGKAREILVSPAYNGSVAPYGTFRAVGFYCDPAWLAGNFDSIHDFGVVQLDNDNVGNRLGWFGIAAYSDAQLTPLLVNVSGYPGDLRPHTQYYNGGRVENVLPAFLLYSFDTEAGMSGAPIFALFSNQRVVVGIHTYGSDRVNRARRIDSTVYDFLARFV